MFSLTIQSLRDPQFLLSYGEFAKLFFIASFFAFPLLHLGYLVTLMQGKHEPYPRYQERLKKETDYINRHLLDPAPSFTSEIVVTILFSVGLFALFLASKSHVFALSTMLFIYSYLETYFLKLRQQ